MALIGAVLAQAGTAQVMNQKLTAPENKAQLQFGSDVALTPGWAFVAATYEDVQVITGAVYVFAYTQGNFTFSQKLKSPLPQFGDGFGQAISSCADWMVVTAPAEDVNGFANKGAAYVFRRNDSTWSFTQKLVASDNATFGATALGYCAAMNETTIVLGAQYDNTKAANAGAAYVFELQGAIWVQTSKLYPQDAEYGSLFGSSVDVEGDTIVVGAMGEDNDFGFNQDHGAVYVFRRANGVWTQRQKLTASDESAASYFGRTVQIESTVIAIGSSSHKHTPDNRGAVYMFSNQSGLWVEMQELLAPDPANPLSFGFSLALADDALIIGALSDADLGSNSGGAYVYRRAADTWNFEGKLLAPDGQESDFFSFSLATLGNMVLVGASLDDDACPETPLTCNSGAAYLFELAPDTTQFCFCKNAGPCFNHDDFGGCAHSQGFGAVLTAAGSTSTAADSLRLEARWVQDFGAGILFMGPQAGAGNPFGDGLMCVEPGTAGLFRFLPVQNSGASGVMIWGPGLVAGTQSNPPPGQISAGQTWYFQSWFRDPSGPCGSTYNLSSALEVRFTP